MLLYFLLRRQMFNCDGMVWKSGFGVALERLRVVLGFGSCFRELGASERSGCKMRAVLPVVGDKEMACHVPPGLCCGVYRGKPHGGLGLSTSSSVEGREDVADSREGRQGWACVSARRVVGEWGNGSVLTRNGA